MDLSLAGKKFHCSWSLITVFIVFSCATSPNTPYNGPAPHALEVLSSKNSLLALELRKLPEIQDGISKRDESILNDLVKLYIDNPKSFDQAFDQMYKIGNPEIRKYCSPLQAFFWLAEDNDNKIMLEVIKNFSLQSLLNMSWNFYDSSTFSDNQIEGILNGIKEENMKIDYMARRKRLSQGMYNLELIKAYKKKKSAFTKGARSIFESAMDQRWEDFDEVTDRLNAPELIDYYERKLFRYVRWYNLPYYPVTSRYVFTHNEGECVSITQFTIYCLKKAGYWAIELRLPGHNAPFHAVCLFKMDGEKYIMDNGRPRPIGIYAYKARQSSN